MTRLIAAVLALACLTTQASAQRSQYGFGIDIDEGAIKEYYTKLVQSLQLPSDDGSFEKTEQRLVASKPFSIVLPKAVDEKISNGMVAFRQDNYWVRDQLVADVDKTLSSLNEAAGVARVLDCRGFSKKGRDCLFLMRVRAIGSPELTGLSLCQGYVDSDFRKSPIDCETFAFSFKGQRYVRAAVTGKVAPVKLPVIPSYQGITSLIVYQSLPPTRKDDFLDALELAIKQEPFGLDVDRNPATNVVLGNTFDRRSKILPLWESITLDLITDTSASPKSSLELIVKVTARLFLQVNEENVPDPQKWHRPNPAQAHAYASTMVALLEKQLQGICLNPVGRAFKTNRGAIIEMDCH